MVPLTLKFMHQPFYAHPQGNKLDNVDLGELSVFVGISLVWLGGMLVIRIGGRK